MMVLGKPYPCTKFEVASFSHCVNIAGEPPNIGELSWPSTTPTLSSACDFMMGQDPSCEPNLKSLAPAVVEIFYWNPKISGSSSNQRVPPLFPLGVILWWALANPNCAPNLKSLSSAVAEILRGSPKFREAPLAQGNAHFSSSEIWWRPWKTPGACQIWSRWLHLIRKYAVFKQHILFLSHPFGS